MKQFFISLLFLYLSAGAFAQQKAPADSIYLQIQSLRRLNDAAEHAASLLNSDFRQISTLSLNYNSQTGHFRTVQTAEKHREITFKSSGISSIGRFRLSGYFNFVKTSEDSLAWSLQGVPNGATPYYFAAAKPGKFERLNYNFGGLLSYALVSDQLFLAAAADYFYNNTARSVDPRSSVQTFRLALHPQLLYKSGQQVFGAVYHYSYGKEDNRVSYKNDQYTGGETIEGGSRVNYLMMGYGYMYPVYAFRMRRQTSSSGVGLSYANTGENSYLNAGLDYEKHLENNLDPLDNSANTNKIGSFTLNDYKGRILTGTGSGKYRQQLQLLLLLQNGFDRNFFKQDGKSAYKYDHQQINFQYSILNRHSAAQQTELGVDVLYDKMEKKDLLLSSAVIFSYIQPGITGSFYNRFRDQSRLALTLAPGLRLPLGGKVNFNGAATPFTSNVMYPDFTYWDTTADVLDFNARYVTSRLLKNTSTGIGIRANYMSTLTSGENFQTSAFSPSGSRLDLTLSVNLYF